MSTSGLIAFALMAVFLIVIPSPLFRFAAGFVLQRGRRAALLTVPSLAIGFSLAAALAAIPLVLASRYEPDLIATFAFVGPWYLLAHVVISALDPARRRPMADNDNLPERHNLKIVGLILRQSTLAPRSILALTAALLQVWNTALPDLPQWLSVTAVCALAVAVAAITQSLLPRRILNRKRPASRVKSAPRKPQTVFIARRAVTAGYRRIAA
jgi:threonine/homoserine/homoserine lactone efflux protein